MVFRLVRGPNREAVLRVLERAGHPPVEVYELPVDLLEEPRNRRAEPSRRLW